MTFIGIVAAKSYHSVPDLLNMPVLPPKPLPRRHSAMLDKNNGRFTRQGTFLSRFFGGCLALRSLSYICPASLPPIECHFFPPRTGATPLASHRVPILKKRLHPTCQARIPPLLKILTVTYSLTEGGVARTAQNFAEGYQRLGIDSRVLVSTVSGSRKAELESKQIPVWQEIGADTLLAILDWNPNIIHLHSHSFGDAEMVFLEKLFAGRTVVEKNIFSRPVPWTRQMDYSYQLSTWCAWRFCNAAPNLSSKAVIVPNGAKISAFAKASPENVSAFKQQHGIPNHALVIGRIGQLYETKWSPILIDAFNRLSQKKPRLYLLLVSPSKAVREQAAASPFQTNIVIIDKILGDQNLSIAYSAMDVFALAADQGESFGNVLAEAMLCEVPVVALSTPWQDNSQCEVVGHEKGGLIVLTPNGFRKALDALLRDESRRKTLGKSGCERVIQKYERCRVAQISVDVIEGKHPPLNLQKLDRQIIEIYRDAFEKPSFLTLWLLKDKRFLRLTRYTTRYWPARKLPVEMIKIIAKKLKKSCKDKNESTVRFNQPLKRRGQTF